MHQWTKHRVVLVETEPHPRKGMYGMIVQCIKDWSPIGDEEECIGKFSILDNQSQDCVEFYKPYQLFIIKEIKEGHPLDKGDLGMLIPVAFKDELIIKDYALFGINIEEFFDDKRDEGYIPYQVVASNMWQGLPKPSQGFLDKFIQKQGIKELLVEENSCNIVSLKHETCRAIVDTHNNIKVRSVKTLWTKEQVEKIATNAFILGNSYSKFEEETLQKLLNSEEWKN